MPQPTAQPITQPTTQDLVNQTRAMLQHALEKCRGKTPEDMIALLESLKQVPENMETLSKLPEKERASIKNDMIALEAQLDTLLTRLQGGQLAARADMQSLMQKIKAQNSYRGYK